MPNFKFRYVGNHEISGLFAYREGVMVCLDLGACKGLPLLIAFLPGRI